MHYFQTESSVYEINAGYESHLPIPSVRLAAIQRSSTYSTIKIFNKLLPRILEFKNGKDNFHVFFKEISSYTLSSL